MSQVDQLIFEELMRERFPKLGLYLLSLLFSNLRVVVFMNQLGFFFILLMLLVQLIIWITWECRCHGYLDLGFCQSL